MELTDSQRRAVETTSRDVLVIAGAGSGKTEVLARRIHHLLQQGASPSDLLVLTFTRKAAAEMKARLESFDWNGQRQPLAGMRIGTFHSVALNILRDEGGVLGYDAKRLTVLDSNDSEALLRQVCRDLGYVTADGTWRGGLSWKAFWNGLEAWHTKWESPSAGPTGMAIGEYAQRLRALNALDYGTILRETRRLFAEHEDVLERYRHAVRHVLVDELQDTNIIQHSLYGYFMSSATFFGVGDRRQSIYGFRGARPDLMTTCHRCAEIIDLRENFRSGEAIVRAANAEIAHNSDALAKPMLCGRPTPGYAASFSGRSGAIVEEVLTLHGFDGHRWSDIAVLARKHATLARLSELMTQAGVPHHVVGQSFDITTTEAFGIIHAALRLCLNPRDDVAFARLVPCLVPSDVEYAAIRQFAAALGRSHFEAYVEDPTLGRGPHPLGRRILDYRSGNDDLRAERWVDEICVAIQATQSGFFGEKEATWWDEHTGGMTVREALDWYALRDSQDDCTVADEVTLSTIHAAKGLQWPIVIIAECNEGTLPSSQALREPDGIEEERRVMYVGMTRARDVLGLHYRREFDQAQDRRAAPPSRFLHETGMHEAAPSAALPE